MKKIITLTLLALVPLMACELPPCDCPPGEQGIQGEKGDKGEKGNTGETGRTGSKGSNGNDGKDGVDGITGSNGSNGSNGINGTNGKNDSSLKVEIASLQEQLKKAKDFETNSAAGNTAMASIDFGTTNTGETEIGIGAGISSGAGLDTAYAGAVGIKHGINDTDAIISKAWVSKDSAYGVGVGVTHKF